MLSCCMIVKNEVEELEKCVSSVIEKLDGFCDEIIVVDTGSTDGTRELALELGCKVYNFEWCGDFAKARNFSLDCAKNDWVIIMDADEIIKEVDLASLRRFAQDENSRIIGKSKVYDYSDKEMQSYTVSVKARMFNKKEVDYKHIIHEMPVMKDNSERRYENISIEVCHTGYIEEVVKNKGKLERNIELIKKSLEKELDLYLVMHLGKSYIGLKMYDEAFESLKFVLESEEAKQYTYYTEAAKEYVRCFLKSSRFIEAMVCEAYWDRCRNNDGYVYLMGHVYMKNGQFEKAMDCFVAIANKEYSSVNKKDALYSLGKMFSILGFHEESAIYFEMCGKFIDAIECAINERTR